ncbi:hypothetical protein E2562_008258 [Oryza meyeriana var. granulata]|uniref:Receptor ligand binding region domain-containing protein n=1 Tax=Oryza meyeriana var. granulata TaxID=110450 RepID=A0A6G1DI37_9ORYZ|nr:hypothetical protein E2562_008258 [Oryza meyeriana var. granulata]
MERAPQSIRFLLLVIHIGPAQNTTRSGAEEFHVGVILDLGSLVGKVARISISLAVEDFYAVHQNYSTRLVLHIRDSMANDVQAASAAVELLENYKVQAIIGPQKSSEAVFVSNLGNKTQGWPGESTEIPRGWEIPTDGKKLRVGVHTSGYPEFIKNIRDPVTNATRASGLSIDIFEEVLSPAVNDLHELQKQGEYVGFHRGSYIEGLLEDIGFDRSKIRPLDTPDDFHSALSNGSKNGGVAALVLEVPYIKLFLVKY